MHSDGVFTLFPQTAGGAGISTASSSIKTKKLRQKTKCKTCGREDYTAKTHDRHMAKIEAAGSSSAGAGSCSKVPRGRAKKPVNFGVESISSDDSGIEDDSEDFMDPAMLEEREDNERAREATSRASSCTAGRTRSETLLYPRHCILASS